jgi:hypothetical protein
MAEELEISDGRIDYGGYELRDKSGWRRMNRIIETDITPRDDPQGGYRYAKTAGRLM